MNGDAGKRGRGDVSRLGLAAFHMHVLRCLWRQGSVPKGIAPSVLSDAKRHAAELRAAVVGQQEDCSIPYGLGFDRRNAHAVLFGFESGQHFEDCASAWVRELQYPHRLSLLNRCEIGELNAALEFAERKGVDADELQQWPHALCSSVPVPLPEDFICELSQAASGATEKPVERFSLEAYANWIERTKHTIPSTVIANATQLLQAWFPVSSLYPFSRERIESCYGPHIKKRLCPNLPCSWVVNWAWADAIYYRDSGSETFNEGPMGPRAQAFLAMGLRDVPGIDLETLCSVVAYKLSRFSPPEDRLMSDQIDAMIEENQLNFSLHGGLQS